MKKTIIMLAMVGVALAACDKKENEPYQFKATEEIYLNGVEQPKFKSTTTQHSLAEIVRHPNTAIIYTYTSDAERIYYRHFAEERMRDTINNRLLMLATDVLTEDGRLVKDFLEAKDVHLRFIAGDNTDIEGDTVGYIPQSVIDNAREQIEALYAQERYDEIYELFHTAFTFYTCTGQEYKDIVANGGN